MSDPADVDEPEPVRPPRRLAGLLEHLVPLLDELAADLVEMDRETAIELDTWPAAAGFVEAWLRER